MSGSENKLLLKNVNDQLSRLVQQMKDLEECREDLTEDEYNETKEETKEQLRYFSKYKILDSRLLVANYTKLDAPEHLHG